MSRRALLTAALVVGSAVLPFLPMPASADEAKLVPAVEGWYQPDPSCAQASGCLLAALPGEVSGAIVTNPYPEGTLHVGVAAGQETARSVLSFPFGDLSGTLTGAVLDVPLDVDPANGDAQSSTAQVQVCLVTGDVVAASGSVAPPPASSCSSRALMKYEAKPAPHLTADLAPVLLGLQTTNGIALLPVVTEGGTEAWHVTFSAHDREGGTTGPATLTVTTAAEDELPEPTLPPVAEEPRVPVSGGFAAAPTTGGLAPAAPVPTTAAPQAPQVSNPVAQPTAQTITVGYAYPVVWLLPLAFLVLVPLASRALTKDLAPV